MKKIILFLLLILASVSVFGQTANNNAFETEFVVESKFTVVGTLADEYNKGIFSIGDDIPFIYAITSTALQVTTFTPSLETFDGERIYCANLPDEINVSSGTGTVYGHCHFEGLNETGHYHLLLETIGYDENEYIVQTIEVVDSDFPLYSIISGIVAFILVYIGFRTSNGGVLILGGIIASSSLITIIVTYMYILGSLGAGLIGLICLFLLMGIYMIIQNK